MAYDGFYSELSTRGATNEVLNLAIQTKEEIEALLAQSESIVTDSAEAAAAAGAAAAEEVLNSKAEEVDLEELTGRVPAIDYVAGLLINQPTQTVRVSGIVYQPYIANLPFTTTTWVADASKFFSVGDAVLRQELFGTGGVLNAPYVITGRTNIRNPYWGAPIIDPHDPAAAAANSTAINLMLASGNTRHELDDVTRAVNSTLLVPNRVEICGAGRASNGLLWVGGDTPIIARSNYADINAAGSSNIRIRDLRITDQKADRSAYWAIDLTNGNSNGLFNCHLDFPLGTVLASKSGIALGKARGGSYAGTTFVPAIMDTRLVNGTVLLNTTDWTIGGDSQIWSLGRDHSIEASGGGTIAPGVQIVPGRDSGLYMFNDSGFNIGTLSVNGVFFDGNTDPANFTGWGIRVAPGIGVVQSIISDNRFWRLNLGGISADKLYQSQVLGNIFENCDSDDTGESDIVISDVYGCKINNTHFRDTIAPKTGVSRTHTTQAPTILTGKVGFPPSSVGGEVGFTTVYGDASLTNRETFQEMNGSSKFALSQSSLPSASTFRDKTVRFGGAEWISDGLIWHQISANRPAVTTGNFDLEGITTSRRIYASNMNPGAGGWINGPAGVTDVCTLDSEYVTTGFATLRLLNLSTGALYTRWYNNSVWEAWVTNSPT